MIVLGRRQNVFCFLQNPDMTRLSLAVRRYSAKDIFGFFTFFSCFKFP